LRQRQAKARRIESLRADPAFAAEYLNSVLEDGEQGQAECDDALPYAIKKRESGVAKHEFHAEGIGLEARGTTDQEIGLRKK